MNRRALVIMAGAGLANQLSAEVGEISAEPEPAVPPLLTELTFEALVELKPAVEIGPSSHGIRRYIPIIGGVFHGPRIKGVVESGGADWQLERPDGVTEVNALYSIRADDGAVIIVRNRGLITRGGTYFRTIPSFEAPIGPHDWLNKAVFVGSVAGAPRPGAVVVRVFRVL